MEDFDLYYIFQDKYFMSLLYILDIALISMIYLTVGLSFSASINKYIGTPLNRSSDKVVVMLEILGETTVTIFAVLFIFFFIAKLPSIAPSGKEAHFITRLITRDVILTFAIVACQGRLLDKIRFLCNPDEDVKNEITDLIIEDFRACPNNNDGFTCKP